MIAECPDCGAQHDTTLCEQTAADCDCCRSIQAAQDDSEVST